MTGRASTLIRLFCCLLCSSLVSSRSLLDSRPGIPEEFSTRRLSESFGKSETEELYKQIDVDLGPYKESGISKSQIDGVFCGLRDPGFRVQIKNQEIYIVGEVQGFQSRQRNIKLALIDMASHHKDLPDVDFVVGTYDWTATEVANIPGLEQGGPVFAQTKKAEHTNAILYPDHTFTDWQEADTASWQVEQYILRRAAMHHPWQARDDRLLFRGSNLTGNRHLAANFTATSEVDIKVWDWVQEPAHEQFLGLPQHCRNKYLLNWPGNSYSARLKYLLLCGSVVVHSENGWYEFFYPMLQHGEHFMQVRTINSTEDLHSELPNLVHHLQAHPKRSRQIAHAGQRFATEILSADNVRQYWYRLLKAYAQLQQFDVVLSPDAVPLGTSVSHPRYVTYNNRTGCPEMPLAANGLPQNPDAYQNAAGVPVTGHWPINEEQPAVIDTVNTSESVNASSNVVLESNVTTSPGVQQPAMEQGAVQGSVVQAEEIVQNIVAESGLEHSQGSSNSSDSSSQTEADLLTTIAY